MIIAFAGRRVDDPQDVNKRFPLNSIERVEAELQNFFKTNHVECMVSSAACGSDLLALTIAQTLNISTVVILPFGVERFKRESVTDRGEPWGQMFDNVINNPKLTKLINLNLHEVADPYEEVNKNIMEEATGLSEAMQLPVRALVAWDGFRKPSDDITFSFLVLAKSRKIPIEEIITR
jgi:hypothetical protein